MNQDPLTVLNKLLVRSVLALGKTGADANRQACQLAAAGYVALRDTHPREAERLNGVLHALTQTSHRKEKTHVEST